MTLKGTTPSPDTNCAMGDFQVKKIILPSGKAVEIVYFHAEPAVDTMPTPTPSGRGLEACPDCASGLVYPIDWHEADSGNWELELRCPECDDVWRAQGCTREIEGFDRTLAAGRSVIERHLREIDRLEREDEIDRFTRALAADAILPEDFTA
jgi:hypothetical protein